MLYWNDTFGKKQLRVWECLSQYLLFYYQHSLSLYNLFYKDKLEMIFQSLKMENFFYPFLLLFANPIKSYPLSKWKEQVAFMLLIQQTPPQKQSYSKMDEVAKNTLTNQKVIFTFFGFIWVTHCKWYISSSKNSLWQSTTTIVNNVVPFICLTNCLHFLVVS